VKVIGIGNPLASDDAIGLHVARELLKVKLPSNVEVIEADSTGPSVLESIAGADKVILIDAAVGENGPGTIHRLSLDNIHPSRCNVRSVHEIDLVDLLRVEKLAQPETFPKELVIIGIEVADTTRCRQGLSDAVRNAIPKAAEFVRSEITPESP